MRYHAKCMCLASYFHAFEGHIWLPCAYQQQKITYQEHNVVTQLGLSFSEPSGFFTWKWSLLQRVSRKESTCHRCSVCDEISAKILWETCDWLSDYQYLSLASLGIKTGVNKCALCDIESRLFVIDRISSVRSSVNSGVVWS